MDKTIRKLAFILLLFFVVGTIAVFALTPDEYNFYVTRGYIAGYNWASSNPRATAIPTGSGGMWGILRSNGIQNVGSPEAGAFREGFQAAFHDQRAGRPNRALN